MLVGEDEPFRFCTVEVLCSFSKSRFRPATREYRFRSADEEGQADCVSNTFKKLGCDGKWDRMEVREGDSIKEGFDFLLSGKPLHKWKLAE